MIIKNFKKPFSVKDFLLLIILIIIFAFIGTGVSLYKEKLQYFFLFFGMGCVMAICESTVILFPKYRQPFRRIAQGIVGGGLLFGISLTLTVNFQFSEIIFDIYAAVVTGALIQFIIARLLMPFFVGNAFCSRVCWDGAIFELAQNFMPKIKTEKPRSVITAFIFLSGIIIVTIIVAYYQNPALDENKRFLWIVGENIFIIISGITLSFIFGRRSYCRMLCPFLSISGLISRFSIFKIKPVKSDNCSNCKKCNKECPMLIDVSHFVKNKTRINNRNCILCEHCVSICPNDCLKLAPGLPWK